MKRTLITAIIIAIAAAIVGYCAYNIIDTLQERYISKQEYENTREEYVSAIKPRTEVNEEGAQASAEGEEESVYFPEREIDVEGLLQKNEDFIAWIYYEDGKIDYPIVQEKTTSIEKYLDTTFDGNKNPSGCLFISYDGDPTFRFKNSFIYGHNMKDGTMFGSLKFIYHSPANMRDPYFYIWTADGKVIKYRVFSAYVVNEDSKMYSIPFADGDYDNYIKDANSLGALTSYIALTKEEKEAFKERNNIVTLSTCYGSAGTTKRLLIQGIEIAKKEIEWDS